MKLEYDEALCAKYPKLFAQRQLPMTETAMCWGFQCGDGWYTLIDELCSYLQWSHDFNKHLQPLQPVVTTVKEKYGQLRFYVDGVSEHCEGAISFAECLSMCICEVCGNPGKMNGGPWYTTRCEEHKRD